MLFIDINRYTGRFKEHIQTLDDKNFKKYIDKMSSLRGTENIYLDIFNFAKKNEKAGYRWFDLGEGTCIKSNKKF